LISTRFLISLTLLYTSLGFIYCQTKNSVKRHKWEV